MKEVINKELLSEILEIKVDNIIKIEENFIYFCIGLPLSQKINIYELAHKCKELCLRKNKYLSSTPYSKDLYVCTILGDEMFEAKTEPEAIFQACDWILKNEK